MKITDDILVYEHPTHGHVPVIVKGWLIDLDVATHLEMAHIG